MKFSTMFYRALLFVLILSWLICVIYVLFFYEGGVWMGEITLPSKPAARKKILIKEAKNKIKTLTDNKFIHIYPDMSIVLNDTYTVDELLSISQLVHELKHELEGA